MKKHLLTLIVLTIVFANIFAQSNRPMATIITEQETQTFDSPQQEQRFITPQLYWAGRQQMTAGERASIVLRSQTRFENNRSSIPPPEFFMPEVPQGVILSRVPLSTQDRNAGILIILTLIPLAAGDFILPARVLEHENYLFEIPALHIRVDNR